MATKVRTGFGPTTLSHTGSTATKEASRWVQFGPITASNLEARAVWSESSAGMRAKVQGIISGSSNLSTSVDTTGAGVVDLIDFNSSLSSQKGGSGSRRYTHIRAASTALSSTETVTIYVASVT